MNNQNKVLTDIKNKVDAAGLLDKEIKSNKIKLDKLKKDIVKHIDSTNIPIIRTPSFIVKLVKKKKYDVINPQNVFEFLRKVGKGKDFTKVVSIVQKDLQKVIGKNELNKLKGNSISDIPSISFVEIKK